MSGLTAVLRRELGATLSSPVAWVACGLFVLGLHAAFFFVGFPVKHLEQPAFWAGKVASLDALYFWLPLFLCVLAPALTMGVWASERSAGTDELLLSLPISTRALVVAKFLASWLLLCGLLVVAILPLAWSVGAIGPLDWGTVGGGLLGGCMLAAACVAIGLCASALAQLELVAFLTSTVVLLGLWSAGAFVHVLPAPLAEAAWYASPSLHFLESGARGLFDVRDVVYFGLLVLAALGVNVVVVDGRRWG